MNRAADMTARGGPPRGPAPRRGARFPLRLAAALAVAAVLSGTPWIADAAPPGKAASAGTATETQPGGTRIVAVVNGDVISNSDVDNRARLFAMSTGLPLSGDVLDRLKPQILRQLIDERLRIQEAQRTKVVIGDKQIAAAIQQIEQRNGMAPGALRQKLAADGVSQRTLIDQIRLQAQQVGKPEYRVGEIFIPIDDPANTADAERFGETVIKELHAGAPFPIVAAQFSQA